MALLKRKRKQVVNPFLYIDDAGDLVNSLHNEDEFGRISDINIEDIIVGCIRSLKADRPESDWQEAVKFTSIAKLLVGCDTLTSETVRNYLRCSERSARRHMEVLKLAVPFIERHLKSPKTGITGYIEAPTAPIYHVHRNELSEKVEAHLKVDKKSL